MGLIVVVLLALALVNFVTWIWLVGMAFKKSPLWGAALILLSPLSTLAFGVTNWQEAKKPFLIHFGSFAGLIVAIAVFFGSVFSAVGGFEMMEAARQMEAGEISEEEFAAVMEQQLERMEESGLVDEEDKAELQQMRAALREQMAAAAAQPDVDVDVTAAYEELMRGVQASKSAERSPGFASGSSGAPEPGLVAANDAAAPVVRELPPVGYDPMRLSDAAAGSVPPPPSSWDPVLEGRVPLGDAKQHVGRLLRVEVREGQEFKARLVDVDRYNLIFEKYMSGGWVTYEVAKNEVIALKLRSY